MQAQLLVLALLATLGEAQQTEDSIPTPSQTHPSLPDPEFHLRAILFLV